MTFLRFSVDYCSIWREQASKGPIARTWGDPEQAPGVLRQVALVCEAYRQSYLVEAKLCIGQELLRPLHPLANDVLVGRKAGRALEPSREVVGAHMCYPGELVEG